MHFITLERFARKTGHSIELLLEQAMRDDFDLFARLPSIYTQPFGMTTGLEFVLLERHEIENLALDGVATLQAATIFHRHCFDRADRCMAPAWDIEATKAEPGWLDQSPAPYSKLKLFESTVTLFFEDEDGNPAEETRRTACAVPALIHEPAAVHFVDTDGKMREQVQIRLNGLFVLSALELAPATVEQSQSTSTKPLEERGDALRRELVTVFNAMIEEGISMKQITAATVMSRLKARIGNEMGCIKGDVAGGVKWERYDGELEELDHVMLKKRIARLKKSTS